MGIACHHAGAGNIPDYFKPYTYFDVSAESGYENLLRFLTGQPRHPPPPIGALRELPPAPILAADPATQDIEKSAVAYAAEEDDDITALHHGAFYPWVRHIGHYELRVRPREYINFESSDANYVASLRGHVSIVSLSLRHYSTYYRTSVRFR